jgi:3',5'-cyclic AMP phosphodiesterase CpdA
MIMLDTADGEVAPQQLAWLESVLASEGAAAARGERSSTLIIWSHHPLICGSHRYMDAYYPLRNAAAVEAVLGAAAPQLTPVVLSGHYHSAATIERGHVTQHIAPATYMQIDPHTSDFQPDTATFGVRFVSIDGRGTVSTSVHTQSLSPGS